MMAMKEEEKNLKTQKSREKAEHFLSLEHVKWKNIGVECEMQFLLVVS
jgi:hypothetical protein